MSLSLTIASVDRTSKFFLPDSRGAFNGSIIPGAKGRLRIDVYDLIGATGYRPAINDTLTLADGGTTIFGGIVDDLEEMPVMGVADGKVDVGVHTKITASDWWAYFDRVTYTKSYPAGTTLKSILQDLVTNVLGTFGITLDAAQVTGPTLSQAFEVVSQTPIAIVSKLTTLTGYIGIVLPSKAFRMTAPASESCGFALGDALTGTVGQVTAKRSRNANYANRIKLTCGDTSTKVVTETYTAVGGDTQFVTVYPATLDYQGIWPNELFVNGVGLGPVDWRPNGAAGLLPGNHWYWDAVNHKLVVDNAAYTPIAGDVITITYNIQYPFEVTYTDPSITNPADIVERDVADTSIFDYNAGVAMAQSLVRQRIANPRQITVRETVGIAYPGMSIVLTYAERVVSGTHLITALDFQNREDGSIEYTLTAVPGSELNGSWLDFWKDLFGGAGVSTATSGSISGAATGTATNDVPGNDKDVVINSSGRLGADDQFQYGKGGTYVLMGQNCTVTAADPVGCFIGGDNCHGTD